MNKASTIGLNKASKIGVNRASKIGVNKASGTLGEIFDDTFIQTICDRRGFVENLASRP